MLYRSLNDHFWGTGLFEVTVSTQTFFDANPSH